MIYVTSNEFIELVRIAVEDSDYITKDGEPWHPEDIHVIFETVAHTVKSVLENAPVDRKPSDVA